MAQQRLHCYSIAEDVCDLSDHLDASTNKAPLLTKRLCAVNHLKNGGTSPLGTCPDDLSSPSSRKSRFAWFCFDT